MDKYEGRLSPWRSKCRSEINEAKPISKVNEPPLRRADDDIESGQLSIIRLLGTRRVAQLGDEPVRIRSTYINIQPTPPQTCVRVPHSL